MDAFTNIQFHIPMTDLKQQIYPQIVVLGLQVLGSGKTLCSVRKLIGHNDNRAIYNNNTRIYQTRGWYHIGYVR